VIYRIDIQRHPVTVVHSRSRWWRGRAVVEGVKTAGAPD
jgi:hypothetical protein